MAIIPDPSNKINATAKRSWLVYGTEGKPKGITPCKPKTTSFKKIPIAKMVMPILIFLLMLIK